MYISTDYHQSVKHNLLKKKKLKQNKQLQTVIRLNNLYLYQHSVQSKSEKNEIKLIYKTT